MPKLKQKIYQKLISKRSKDHKIAREILWKKNIPSLDFKHIWKNTFYSYHQPFCRELHYKLLHYSTKTNDYLQKCSPNNNPN